MSPSLNDERAGQAQSQRFLAKHGREPGYDPLTFWRSLSGRDLQDDMGHWRLIL